MFFKLLPVILTTLITVQGFTDESPIKHRLEFGSSPADVCRRLHQTPLFNAKGCVTKIMKLNPSLSEMGETNIPPGTLITLPNLNLKPSELWIVHENFLYFRHIKNISQIAKTSKKKPSVIFVINQSKTSSDVLNQVHKLSSDVDHMTLKFDGSHPRSISSLKNQMKIDNGNTPLQSNWELSTQAGTGSRNIDLTDNIGRRQSITTHQVWSIGAELAYKSGANHISLELDYGSLNFQSANEININKREVDVFNFEAQYKRVWTSYFYSSIGLGSTSLVSFINTSNSTMDTLNQQRSLALLEGGFLFPFLTLSTEVFLKGKVLSPVTVNNIDFEVGNELSLGIKASQPVSSSTSILFSTNLLQRDDSPLNYKQTTSGVSFGLGLRWQL